MIIVNSAAPLVIFLLIFLAVKSGRREVNAAEENGWFGPGRCLFDCWWVPVGYLIDVWLIVDGCQLDV